MARNRMVTAFMPDSTLAWHVTIYGSGDATRFLRSFGEGSTASDWENITESAFHELCHFAHYIGLTVLYTVATPEWRPFVKARVTINGLQTAIDAQKGKVA